MYLATIWAIFLQAHLVTLAPIQFHNIDADALLSTGCQQGCQRVDFQTKNPS
jgi:hypothetical protein